MIEGVLRHCTDMEIQRQYVDSHGQTAVGFAFCHLLGFELAPRLKAIARQKLVLPAAGMRARLHFGIATAVTPEILLIDEVLAVGDRRTGAPGERLGRWSASADRVQGLEIGRRAPAGRHGAVVAVAGKQSGGRLGREHGGGAASFDREISIKGLVIFVIALVVLLAVTATAQVKFEDPTGDDNGPGAYVYPTDSVYAGGSFDLTGLEVGDEVRTIGGIYGTIRSEDDDTFTLDIGGGSTMRVAKRAISERIGDDSE